MNRGAKLGLIAVVLSCVIAAPLAYQNRRLVHRLLHRLKHSLIGKTAGSAAPTFNSLKIGGTEFSNVLGYPPYYLAVKQIDTVLFVTRRNDGGSNFFNVLNLKTGLDEQIPSIADFGRNIGLMGGGFRDYVERAGPGEMLVVSEMDVGRRMKTVYRLDLSAGIVDTREVFYYDSNGRITNTSEGPGF